MYRRQDTIHQLAALGLGLLLASCTRTAVEPMQPLETRLVWPPSPAQPRIQLIRTFSKPGDLGIARGFLQRLGKLFTGRSESHLVHPMAVVATSDGVLYVADPGAKGIHRFDPAKARYDLIRLRGGKPLASVVGLTSSPGGEVYGADSLLAQLFIIAPGSKVATPVPLEAEVEQPTGIALDPAAGKLYLVDTRAHQVKVFGVDGELHSTFGSRGTGDGEFNYPTAIWRDMAGRLFIADSLNFRVQIFDGNGRFLGKFGQLGDATGDFSRPKGVATDHQGHIYVVDSLFHAVQIFDMSGDFLLSFGRQGQGPGEFWLPTGIFIGESDTVYVADSHNRRIQVFQYIGGQS